MDRFTEQREREEERISRTELQKDDWAICNGEYVQIEMPAYRRGFMVCRKAGSNKRKCISVKRLTKASLTPDFSNAKAGDECFSVEEGICKIIHSRSDSLPIVAMNKSGGWDAFEKDGKLDLESTHPLLFNSFAQFQAYWAEQALEMATQRSKS